MKIWEVLPYITLPLASFSPGKETQLINHTDACIASLWARQHSEHLSNTNSSDDPSATSLHSSLACCPCQSHSAVSRRMAGPGHMESPHWPGQLGDDWNLFLGLSKEQSLMWPEEICMWGSVLPGVLLCKWAFWALTVTGFQEWGWEFGFHPLSNLQREGKPWFLKSQVMLMGWVCGGKFWRGPFSTWVSECGAFCWIEQWFRARTPKKDFFGSNLHPATC